MTTEIHRERLPGLPPSAPHDEESPLHDGAEAEARAGAHAAVAAEEPKALHEYDGIRELDNALPNWWLYTFYATVIFALGYWFHYQVFKNGLMPRAAYEQEMQADYAARAARLRAMGTITPAAIEAIAHDQNSLRQGQAIFTSTCAPCHGANAGGVIGPNLTDEYWLHGGRADQIYHTISEGVPARGMPSWGPQLGNDRVMSVAAYVVSLRNTHAHGGRPPQGEREP